MPIVLPIHLYPKWMEGEVDRTDLVAVCPNCEEPYTDAAIFSVKNYPDDGGALLFLECENCEYEAQMDINWKKNFIDPRGLPYVIIPRPPEEE